MGSETEKLIRQFKTETDPFTKAQLLRALTKEHDIRLTRLANIFSMKPAYLCHFLRLNNLPDIVVDGFYAKNISLSHLFVISRLKDKQEMLKIYETVLTKNLTVNQTEEKVREILYNVKTEGKKLTVDEKNKFVNLFGHEVQIKLIQTRIKSKLILEIKGSLAVTTKKLREILSQVVS